MRKQLNNFAKIILNTCTSHSQNFSVVGFFVLELLGHRWQLLYLFLYFYVLLRTLIKTEQTIEKTPNFAKIIFITGTCHNPSFNVLGCLVLELLGFSVYMYIYTYLCSFADFDKNGTNNWKNTKLSENHYHYLNKRHSKNFNVVGSFVLELLGFSISPYFYVLLRLW